MNKKQNELYINPKLLAKVAIGGFSIHLITLFLDNHFLTYCIPAIVLNIIFVAYFLLILRQKNMSTTILNIVLFIFLALATPLLGLASSHSNFLAKGIWFGINDALLTNYLVALITFLLLMVVLFGIIRKSRLKYSVWGFIIIALTIIGFVLSVIESYLVTPISVISDLALGTGYVGMALFLSEYGNTIKVKREMKKCQK